jgi:hypothetical protein
MDAEGAIWCSTIGAEGSSVDRVREGGEVLQRVETDLLQRVETDLPCVACMLGGHDGKTLFMLVADWRLGDGFEDNIRRLTTGPRTGKILTAPAPAPHAGWPSGQADDGLNRAIAEQARSAPIPHTLTRSCEAVPTDWKSGPPVDKA